MLSNTISIVKGVEDALFDVTEKFLNSQDNWGDDYFKLNAFSFIFANALEQLIKNERNDKSTNEEEVKNKFSNIISSELEKLSSNHECRKDFENKLEDNLYIMHMKPKKVSYSPYINFIYWALKNTSRLCISPEGVNFAMQVAGIKSLLSSYSGLIFSTIRHNNKKNLTSKAIYQNLLNNFVDEIVNWKFYYKNI